jgi:hypothetical protein
MNEDEVCRFGAHPKCEEVEQAGRCSDYRDCAECALANGEDHPGLTDAERATLRGCCGKCEGHSALPADAASRKAIPLATGLMDYFPAALIEIAKLSQVGNDQHNPGEPLHWARAKSGDEDDAAMRHFVERGGVDTDGIRHRVKFAWRALAGLQKELEAAGAPLARGARVEG